MTRDEIAQAMQDTAGADWGNEAHFQRFAKLLLDTEREACARVCDRNAEVCNNNSMLRDVLMGNAAAIRARGYET